MLLIGKVYEAVGRASGRGRGHVYDVVVLDAPPTGRVVRFLGVNDELAQVARVGPIRAQADSITAMLQSRITVVHLVTLLEEMPVQECLDAMTDIAEAGLHVGGIVVNQVRDPILSEDDLDTIARGVSPALRAEVSGDLESVGIKDAAGNADVLLREASEHIERLDLQAEQDQRIRAQGRAVFYLPALADGLDSGGIGVLAEELVVQEMV